MFTLKFLLHNLSIDRNININVTVYNQDYKLVESAFFLTKIELLLSEFYQEYMDIQVEQIFLHSGIISIRIRYTAKDLPF